VPVSLPTFERLARADHTQEHASLWDAHGNLIVQRSGNIDSVAFHPEEYSKPAMAFSLIRTPNPYP
jgi:hypothetical protein